MEKGGEKKEKWEEKQALYPYVISIYSSYRAWYWLD